MDYRRVPETKEVRERINGISDDDYLIPSPSAKFPNGVRRISGKAVKVTSKLALIGGFRISEVCSKYSKNSESGNSSDTLKVFVDEHKATGEEVLRVQVEALKKKKPVIRDIGLPLDRKHEPFSKDVLDAWEEENDNPCKVNRQEAWYVNRSVFYGLGYRVEGRNTLKPGGNHFLRHMRAIELRELQLTPEERVSFFKWSSRGVGINPMIMTYSQPDWFEYFPKLLKRY